MDKTADELRDDGELGIETEESLAKVKSVLDLLWKEYAKEVLFRGYDRETVEDTAKDFAVFIQNTDFSFAVTPEGTLTDEFVSEKQ